MRLSHTDQGRGEPALVILHGLFGSARNWAGLARRFAARRRVIAVDARNHGASPWADRMTYADMADDVAALIAGIRLARPAILGHSMGGKTAMTMALTAPHVPGALIVADMAPVAYGHSHLALVAAMRALDLSAISRRADADAALRPLAPQRALRDFLLQNLVFEGGKPRWRLNLAAIARHMTDLIGFDLPPQARPWDGPALFLHGGRSPYVRPEHHAAIRHWFPAARIQAIADAGHWLHAERPAEFAAAVEGFLDSLG